MASINKAVLDLKRLDLLANNDSVIHRLDARAKVLVTCVFILCIVSYDRYELSALFPFFIFPAVLIALAGLPPLFIAKKIALLCPFVLVVGIFNPVFDREVLVNLGPLGISGGWISFASIMVRSILTVGAAFILVGVTGFTAVCQALERLGMPQGFAVQLVKRRVAGDKVANFGQFVAHRWLSVRVVAQCKFAMVDVAALGFSAILLRWGFGQNEFAPFWRSQ